MVDRRVWPTQRGNDSVSIESYESGFVMKKKYTSPKLTDLGLLVELTAGTMGSFNDGGGAGTGMADLDGNGGMDDGGSGD